MSLSMNPLKQGLKLEPVIDQPNNLLSLSMNPLKQGLKHIGMLKYTIKTKSLYP